MCTNFPSHLVKVTIKIAMVVNKLHSMYFLFGVNEFVGYLNLSEFSKLSPCPVKSTSLKS